MVDDVRNITETAESKEALDRSRLARERREAEQRKRLDELRAHAAAAQAQREKRDEDRRKRQADQRAKDDDRRVQVEERKRAIWEASISRREALLQRERDRAERLERARAARSAPRPAFAFGSSTPRLLDPLDSAGFFWAARSTNPIDQMNFFESLAASTTNVMFVSAPLTRRASALQLDTSDTDTKDEQERSPAPAMWSSVARRRTDLVPTVPLGRAPGRAHSMTRLDRLPPQRPLHSASPSMHHLNRTQCRSGETTPGSRPGSALSNAPGVVRRTASTPRKPRPASIAGTGVNTPRGGVGVGGGGDVMSQSVATTPSVSRDSTLVAVAGAAGGGDVSRRAATTPRRPRPLSMHASHKPSTPATPGEGKPPVHRKPKPSKEHDKSGRGKSLSVSPGRARSPPAAPLASKHSHVEKEPPPEASAGQEMPGEEPAPLARSEVSAEEVTQKLEALQITSDLVHDQTIENKESVDVVTKMETKVETVERMIEEKTTEPVKPVEVLKPVEREEKKEDKKEPSQEKTEDNEMTASMSARRITTEEQAKAALAERRRRAREELERQADLERQRLQREAEEEAERQRQEEERQRREEEEARELAQLQRRMDEEKLRKAIEAQQQLERDEAERKAREEAERQARARDDEEKRRHAEEAERLRREEAEREERERLARKQRVEAIMARTRLRKAEEEKKSQEKAQSQAAVNLAPAPHAQDSAPAAVPVQEDPAAVPASEPVPVPVPAVAPAVLAVEEQTPTPAHDNGNVTTGDLLAFDSSQTNVPNAAVQETTQTNTSVVVHETVVTNNGNVTADLLGLSEQNNTEDKIQEQSTQKQIDKSETSNGNTVSNTVSGVALLSAEFLQSERAANDNQTKMAADIQKLLDDDFTAHNGHGALNHPLTLQNAI